MCTTYLRMFVYVLEFECEYVSVSVATVLCQMIQVVRSMVYVKFNLIELTMHM